MLRNVKFTLKNLTRSNIYRIEMMVPSWTGYLRQRERLTKAEQETINKVWRLHVGEDVPEERYYLCVNRELDVRGTTVTHPSNMSIRSLDLGARELRRTRERSSTCSGMSEIPKKPAWGGWSSHWFSLFSYEIGR
jgi:Transmembrane secretion effector